MWSQRVGRLGRGLVGIGGSSSLSLVRRSPFADAASEKRRDAGTCVFWIWIDTPIDRLIDRSIDRFRAPTTVISCMVAVRFACLGSPPFFFKIEIDGIAPRPSRSRF